MRSVSAKRLPINECAGDFAIQVAITDLQFALDEPADLRDRRNVGFAVLFTNKGVCLTGS
jgi:hypothetical protein